MTLTEAYKVAASESRPYMVGIFIRNNHHSDKVPCPYPEGSPETYAFWEGVRAASEYIARQQQREDSGESRAIGGWY